MGTPLPTGEISHESRKDSKKVKNRNLDLIKDFKISFHRSAASTVYPSALGSDVRILNFEILPVLVLVEILPSIHRKPQITETVASG